MANWGQWPGRKVRVVLTAWLFYGSPPAYDLYLCPGDHSHGDIPLGFSECEQPLEVKNSSSLQRMGSSESTDSGIFGF